LVLSLADKRVWGFLSRSRTVPASQRRISSSSSSSSSSSTCSSSSSSSSSRGVRASSLHQSTPAVDDAAAVSSRDLSGYSLWVTFQGFGVERMSFGIELKPKYEAIFSRGIEAAAPGFWRVAAASDGRETLDVTHPVLPEYMFFFDLWEKTVTWSGQLDVARARVVDGVVTTNKKRFGIFPYAETLATFEAELLLPGQKLPDVVLPKFSDLNFLVRCLPMPIWHRCTAVGCWLLAVRAPMRAFRVFLSPHDDAGVLRL